VRNLDCALAAFDKVFVERTLIPPDAALDDEGLFTRRENGRFLFQACTQWAYSTGTRRALRKNKKTASRCRGRFKAQYLIHADSTSRSGHGQAAQRENR
jgi:hypothetical protein